MLTLDVLGPVVLSRDGLAIALTVQKTQALLVLLAVGGAQPRSRIAAWLWPQLDESSARRNLRRELARLREAGAADAVRAEGDLLALGGGVDSDLRRFESALARGAADAALAEWRGFAVDGLHPGETPAFGDWLENEVRRWQALRRQALEKSALSREAAGQFDAALERIDALLADDPLQERYHRDAMRLHAAAGRRGAALVQYERCCRLLADELGLQPMAETLTLSQALRGDPVHVEPRPAAAVLALPDRLPYVGREGEVALLEAAWVQGHAVVLEGEAGIGKTRLAIDFAAAHGPYALLRCRPADAALPYAAFARALRVLAGGAAPPDDLPAWVRSELARLLPEWGEAPPPITSAEERSRLVEACVRAWLALAVPNFDAVIVDDWHLADAESQALLLHVAERRAEQAPQAAREVWLLRPGLSEARRRPLQAWCDAGGAVQLTLAALPGEAVYRLLQDLARATDPRRFAARLHRATGGNPFFIAETLRHLAGSGLLRAGADGVWTTPFDEGTETYAELPLPASVREAVLARVAALPEGARRLLEAASLAAEPFAPGLLAAACAFSELDALTAIDSALAARLLREHEAGGYAFAHDLVQHAIDGALPAERRRLVHRRLALGAEAAGAAPATIALHHECAGDAVRAVPFRLAAAEQARGLYALPEATLHWRQALADGATPRQALGALEGLMQVSRLRCEFDEMQAQGEALLRLVADAELTPQERAGAVISIADGLAYVNRAAQALEMLERLPDDLPRALQGRRLMARSFALNALGRLDEAQTAAKAALDMAEVPAAVRLQLLDSLTLAQLSAGDLVGARSHAEAGLSLSERIGDKAGAARATLRLGLVASISGDLAGAEAQLQKAAQRSADRGDVNMQRNALYNLCAVYQGECRHVQALATAQHGWDLRPPLPRCDLRLMFRLALVDSHVALGDLGTAWDQATLAIDEALAHPEPYYALATANCTLELLGLLGELPLARRLLASTTTDAARELKLQSAEVCTATAQFELKLGDATAARRALAAGPQPQQIADIRVRVRHALASAELSLAEDDAAAALAQLPADDAPGTNDELRTRGLALRLRAELRAGELQDSSLRAARAALAAPSPYMPATLELQRALAAVEATQAGVDVRLAASLRAHPEQRARFLAAARHAYMSSSARPLVSRT